MLLTPKAEALIRKYVAGLATSYGVPDTSRFFALTDPRDIQLRNALLQQSEFLQLINAQTVEQVQGQVVATGNPGLFTGRKKDGRFSRKMGNSGNEYNRVSASGNMPMTVSKTALRVSRFKAQNRVALPPKCSEKQR
ncbi:TPA: P2 family phage major capsid protein [Klebsiella pneumoniae]